MFQGMFGRLNKWIQPQADPQVPTRPARHQISQSASRRRDLVPTSPQAGGVSAAEVPAVRDRTGHRNRGTKPGTAPPEPGLPPGQRMRREGRKGIAGKDQEECGEGCEEGCRGGEELKSPSFHPLVHVDTKVAVLEKTSHCAELDKFLD
ncbi:hypothetical protein Nmel_006030 [Mimus melanotis]